MSNENRNGNGRGRPTKDKGPLRNFKFRSDIDEFLTDEAGEGRESGKRGRTGKGMTLYLEQALAYLMKLKPAVRDAEMSKALNQK